MKVTLNNITSRYGGIAALNDNFSLIETAFENTLSRDGTSPNAMEDNLDMNNNSILNANAVNCSSLTLNGVTMSSSESFLVAGFTEIPAIVATAGQTDFDVSPTVLAPTSLLLVYVNGLKIPQASVSFLTSTVTLPAMEEGDEIEVVEVKVG